MPPPPPGMFRTADKVEYISGERDEGFRGGAYFAATVVRTFPVLLKYTIQYDTLLDSNDPTKPLREEVDASRLRPAPPAVDRSVGALRVVDALYKDGWWIGILAGIRDDGLARVLFPATREEMVFAEADVRPHLEWNGQDWVKPEDLELPLSPYEEGTHVEVPEIKDSIPVAWLPATIGRTIWKNCVAVNYSHSTVEAGPSNSEEIVHFDHIRPCPPLFSLNDEVEVCHNGRWSPGVITEAYNSSCYSVKLEYLKRDITADQEKIRFRKDWVNGQWILASQGTTVEVTSNEKGYVGSWFEATILQNMGQEFVVEYKTLLEKDGSSFLTDKVKAEFIRPQPPKTPASYKFRTTEEVDLYYNNGWWPGVISKVKSSLEYVVHIAHSNKKKTAVRKHLRAHYNWVEGGWVRPSHGNAGEQ